MTISAPALDIDVDADRLARRAVETGDPRYLRAAALLAGADAREFRRDWGGRGRRMRDDAVRALAARFFPNDPPTRQAQEIARRMAHYAGAGWPRHQHAVRCPPAIADTIEGAFWRIWTTYKFQILCDRQLRRIVGA